MNQLCRVCGEPAAGFHFGAFTCEGCKSFFGRTYNNLSSISECKNNGECVINKKNRTSCKACRLRKCLLVGMSKSGSRYGRRSNWFKIHCLLQEQQQSQQTSAKPGKGWDGVTFHPGKHILDADNNNTPNAKDGRERALSPMLLPSGYNAAGDAAAALWAARNSMLPVHPHHAGIPFFAPPFLHNSPFSQPQPATNFLLPFIPPRQPRPEAQVISASSSATSSPSPEPQNTADKSTETDLFNADKCLSVLKSLGPVQETPMDLSFSSRNKNIRSSDNEDSNDNVDIDNKKNEGGGDENDIKNSDDESDSKDKSLEVEMEKRIRTTPLDLTCTKS